MYVLEGQVRFRQGDENSSPGPAPGMWQPCGIPYAFKVESKRARAPVVVTPGGFERIFEQGGTPLSESAQPPVQQYDPDTAAAIAAQFGFDVVGTQLDWSAIRGPRSQGASAPTAGVRSLRSTIRSSVACINRWCGISPKHEAMSFPRPTARPARIHQ